MSNVPNLYSFATKELAQDVTVAYILAWGRLVYQPTAIRSAAVAGFQRSRAPELAT